MPPKATRPRLLRSARLVASVLTRLKESSWPRFVDYPYGRPGLDLLGLPGMGTHEPVARIAVQHEAVVGVRAVRPETDRLREVPGIHLALARPVRQVHRQEI